jgi:Protein of unknown function (DUF2808)
MKLVEKMELSSMRFSTFTHLMALTPALLGVLSLPSNPVQLGDGSTAFVNPPRLIRSTTTNSDVFGWSATYYFTVEVPETAGEPLQKLTIQQREGFDRDLDYDLRRSVALEGVSYRRKAPRISLGNVTFDRKTQTLVIPFDPPVAPGKTVTVGVSPYSNPSTGGIYLFGVTASPPGEKVRSQFLGFGRLSFFSRGP